jgi:hypothetical protein
MEQASGLGLAGETENAPDAKIKAAIKSASQIFLVGLSGSESNEQLLGLDHVSRIFAQNFRQLDHRLSRSRAQWIF